MNKGYLLQPVIDKGLSLMLKGNQLSSDMLSIWYRYADSIMRLACTDSKNMIYYNQFLNLEITLNLNRNIDPIQQLHQMLQFLIQIQARL